MVTIEYAAVLPEITRRIVEAVHPLRILLFGSRARGDARPDSDIDLLVIVPRIDDKRRQTVEIMRLLRELRTPVDIVVTSPDEITRGGAVLGSVLSHALREGVVLYG